MIWGKDREETVKLTAQAYGIPEMEARFILAQELGEIDSDDQVVDEHGNVILPHDYVPPTGDCPPWARVERRSALNKLKRQRGRKPKFR